MKEVLDIYTKLVIAVISFIAPLIVHLLSVFNDGIETVRRRYKEKINQTDVLLQAHLNTGGNLQQAVSDANEEYKDKKEELERQVNLLNPKRQIRRIFPTLFISLVCVMLYHLCKCEEFSGWWISGKAWLRYLLLFLSLCFSTLGIIFLKNVAWAVIEVKQQIAKENEKKGSKEPVTKKS